MKSRTQSLLLAQPLLPTIKTIFAAVYSSVVKVRGYAYSCILSEAGEKFSIGRGCRISGPEKIVIKDNVSIENNCSLYGQGGITIGNNTMIASYVHIISQNHNFASREIPMRDQGLICKGVTIEEDVWIGISCVILSGVKIGKGSIVGAGSVVTKDVEPYSIYAGNPAKLIRKRM